MSLVIADERYLGSDLSIAELQAEVQSLIELDMRTPEGRAHVAEAMLRRYPTMSQNAAVQVAVLEGEVVRRETILQLIGWVLGGQTYFRLLRKFASSSVSSG
jgi:hypothetical protein